jgi:hypothetical protein
MNRGALSEPSFIGSFKRPPMKKEPTLKTPSSFKRPPMKKVATQKTQMGSFKRPLMKKEAISKNAKGLAQKTSDEKGGNPEKRNGARSEDL